MTSPKQMKIEAEGYIHLVSDVKQGKYKKYFTAVLQEATKNTKMVIFTPQKHNWFVCAEKDRSPVKVGNITLTPSRQNQGENDILINERAQLTCVRNLGFCFDELAPKDQQTRSISDILSDPREHQIVNVVVKVLEQREKEEITTRTHKVMDKTVYAVSDKTASIMLTVWGNDVLVIDKWYTFTDVSVRFFNNNVLLTTTPQSTFNIAEDGGAASPAVKNDAKHTVGEIVQVDVTSTYLCPQRHAVFDVNPATLMTRCEKCSKYCKNTKLTSLMRGTIVLEDEEKNHVEFILDDKLIRSLVQIDNHVLNQCDHIVQNIMQHDRIDITARGKRAIAVLFCDDEPKPSTSTEADKETTQICELHQPMGSPMIPSPNSADSWDL
ncbi:uncharacterized protein LOC124463518 [Hypomesus transpacificus]|uniref:uncharacterized protein LOC124463518 n=1 Tax=Hypomesus transpacificus TaxID=137520 RepID=UPI001F078971|nr:uncharacterized protein LOC124463518 [Hypomesus transpacificus]